MNSVRKGLFNDIATFRTNLGCSPRINSDNFRTGTVSLVRKHVQKLSPGSVTHAFRDVTAAKSLNVQILYNNKTKLINQSVGKFVLKIPALVGNVLILLGNQFAKHPVPFASFLGARSSTLNESQLFLSLAKPARIIDLLTRRQRSKVFKPHVNADFGFTVRDKDKIRQLNLEDDVPIIQLVSFDNSLFDSSIIGDGTMLEDTNGANVLDTKSAILQAEAIIIAEFKGRKPAFSLKSWIARGLALLASSKERSKGFIQSAKDLLTGRKIQFSQTIRVILTNLLQLVGLVIVVYGDLMISPSVLTLLKSSIIEQTTLFNQKVEAVGLIFSWVKSVFVASIHSCKRWPRRLAVLLSEQHPLTLGAIKQIRLWGFAVQTMIL